MWKKLLFALITTAVVLVLLEVALAIVGVRPILYEKDPYVGFASRIPLFVQQTAPGGGVEMVTAENKRNLFNQQRFPKEKPDGTYRIFCLGGSTTYGRPYDDTTSFCGWLRAFLPEADPSRRWEVINAGGISYASYRVALVAEEAIRYEPDLLIVYTGQNEFLERRTYDRLIRMPRAVRGFGALASRTRIYAALNRAVEAVGHRDHSTDSKQDVLGAEVTTLLDDAVGPEAYHRDDTLREQVLDHYRFNLARMIDIARSAGAEIVLVTPASNLRNCGPFKSEHRAGLSEAQSRRWQAQFDRGTEALAEDRPGDALSAFDEAAAIDDRYAELHYRRGRALVAIGRYEQAKVAFRRARDEDVCPLRALGPMREIVAEVASERGVPVVDFATLVESRADHGIPGEDWFLDHVHPTIEGNRLLARSILDEMVRQRIVDPVSDWGDAAIQRIAQRVEGSLDRRAHGVALKNLSKVLAWAGKWEEAGKLAGKAAQLLPDDAEIHYQIGLCAAKTGDPAEAEAAYRRALELNPDYTKARVNLGLLAQRSGRTEMAVDSFNQALAANPNDHKAHFNLAVACLQRREFDATTKHCSRAIELHPEYPEAHIVWATALAHRGQVREAAGHLEKAIELDPDKPLPHLRLGTLQASLGEYAAAVGRLREAVALDPGNAEAKDRLAWLLATAPEAEVRDGPEAVRLANELCRQLGSDNPIALRTLAAARAEAGRFDEAAETARRAIRLARSAGEETLVNDLQARLAQFSARQACRESATLRR